MLRRASVRRFKKIIGVEQRRDQVAIDVSPESDSPVFMFLNGMTPPTYDAHSYIEPPAYIYPPAQRQEDKVAAGESLASVIDAAETAKKSNDLPTAISLFMRALDDNTTVSSGCFTGCSSDYYRCQY